MEGGDILEERKEELQQLVNNFLKNAIEKRLTIGELSETIDHLKEEAKKLRIAE
jgi:hypothetical protein